PIRRMKSKVQFSAAGRKILLEHITHRCPLLAEAAGNGEVQQFLHQRGKARRSRPGSPVHIHAAGVEEDSATVARPFHKGWVTHSWRAAIAPFLGAGAGRAWLGHEGKNLTRSAPPHPTLSPRVGGEGRVRG